MHVIGTAGHVDHGKSTLVERLTGMDPDRFAEEKRRGLTIDLGFAWLTLPSGNEIGIIDVPGHERFIRNMLAGAGGTTICLFVVAANEGWKPQSAEHLAILDVLGVSSGVVALTKSDTVDAGSLDSVRRSIENKLGGSALNGAPIVPVSAAKGEGLEELISELDRVVQAADPAPDLGRPRLWVDRVFTIAGAGTVVTGTLGGGSFAAGDEVEISPEGRNARVRTIQSHKKELRRVEPGNRTALNLAGLERQGAERGDAVVRMRSWRPTRVVHARIRVLDPAIAGREHTLTEKGAHLLYIGTAETPVRIRLIGAKKIVPGAEGFAELQLRDRLPLARDDRFVLRDAGRVLTFGGGTVLDPMPTLDRRASELPELLEQLAATDAQGAVAALVAAEGMLTAANARLRTGADEPPDGARRLDDLLVSERRFAELSERLREELARHHSTHPLERGASRELIRREVLPEKPKAFDFLVAQTETVVDEGTVLRLDTHEVRLDPKQEEARLALVGQIEAAGFNPPLSQELRTEHGLVDALVDSGDLIKVGNFFLTAGRAEEARSRVRQHIQANGPMTVAEIRDLLDTSRKYAVPLVEWLDATGATIRKGDLRLLGPRA